MNKTIIYYTANREKFEQKIIDDMWPKAGDIPIVSVSQKPMDLGTNICVGDVGYSYLNERKQILIAAEAAKTEYVVTAESDFLYPTGYFYFEPKGANIYRYENVWIMWLDDRKRRNFYRKTATSDGAQIVRREFLIDLLTKYLTPYPGWYRQNDRNVDPRHSPYHRVDFEVINSEIPCVSIKSREGLTYITGVHNDDTKEVLPYWGNVNDLRSKFLLSSSESNGPSDLQGGTTFPSRRPEPEHVLSPRTEIRSGVGSKLSKVKSDSAKIESDSKGKVSSPKTSLEPDSEKSVVNTKKHLIKKYGTGDPLVALGMLRHNLYQLFAELGFKVGAEVGLFRGRNARQMFREIPGLKLYGVDAYDDQPYSTRHKTVPRYDRNRRMMTDRIRGRNIKVIEKFSEEAVQEIPYDSLDFVYIDGDHSYDYMMTDIILWSRRVRAGGIVSGHDYVKPGEYRHKYDINVKEAVDDYIRMHKISPWYLTDKKGAVNKSDKCPTWFFVKE